jgi:Spy/CpxP family protein refolding chaperone
MNRWPSRLLWALATVLLAGGTAFLVTRAISRDRAAPHAAAEDDFHHWMHEQLKLTSAQHDALDPIEKAFEQERARLRSEIANAGRDLADAVRRGKSGSPEIDAALTRLNAAQAALQRATLDHFFAMKDHLEPAQAEKLLQWTHDSILPR